MGNVFEPRSAGNGNAFEPADAAPTAHLSRQPPGARGRLGRAGVFEPVAPGPSRALTAVAAAGHGDSFTRVVKNVRTLVSVLNCAVGVYKLLNGDLSGVHDLTGSGDDST